MHLFIGWLCVDEVSVFEHFFISSDAEAVAARDNCPVAFVYCQLPQQLEEQDASLPVILRNLPLEENYYQKWSLEPQMLKLWRIESYESHYYDVNRQHSVKQFSFFSRNKWSSEFYWYFLFFICEYFFCLFVFSWAFPSVFTWRTLNCL